MIRYLKVNKETADRILNGLVGLSSAVASTDIRTTLSLASIISSPKRTYSLFTKFGVSQPLPNAETEYVMVFRDGFVIPMKVHGYDAKKKELEISTCIVKPGYHDKIDVEKNHLAHELQLGKTQEEVSIKFDPNDTGHETSLDIILSRFRNKQLFIISNS